MTMWILLVAVVGSILLSVATSRVERWYFKREARRFTEAFPGKCMICSFHRMGRFHGHHDQFLPEPHDCIERRSP